MGGECNIGGEMKMCTKSSCESLKENYGLKNTEIDGRLI
jgi:hypothetical protein